MTIEKKGATKQSAEKTDKAIRKFVLDNPVLTKTQSVIDKIDKLKKKGILPIKKNKGGGADMGAKKKKYKREPQTRNKMQPSRSMSIDTTTGISKMREGGICRGAGAAVKGTKFQGVF